MMFPNIEYRNLDESFVLDCMHHVIRELRVFVLAADEEIKKKVKSKEYYKKIIFCLILKLALFSIFLYTNLASFHRNLR